MAHHTRSLIGAAFAVALYFANGSHEPVGATPMVFGARNPVTLRLELRASSVKERDELPTLAAEGKARNVQIEMTEFRKGVAYLPATFIVNEAVDLRVDGPYQTLSIRFLIGRSMWFYALADHFGLIGWASDLNWEGTYRVQARYQNLTTPPAFVTIR